MKKILIVLLTIASINTSFSQDTESYYFRMHYINVTGNVGEFIKANREYFKPLAIDAVKKNKWAGWSMLRSVTESSKFIFVHHFSSSKQLANVHNNSGEIFDGNTAKKMGLTRYAIYSRLKQNGSDDDIRSPELDLFVQPNKREKNSVKLGWTDDRTELLKQMWQDGSSASTIATKLGGGATRSSVLGKAHRLKLNKQNQNQIEELTNDEKEWSRSEIRRLTTLVELGYEPEVLSKILDKDQTDIEQKLKEITPTGM